MKFGRHYNNELSFRLGRVERYWCNYFRCRDGMLSLQVGPFVFGWVYCKRMYDSEFKWRLFYEGLGGRPRYMLHGDPV